MRESKAIKIRFLSQTFSESYVISQGWRSVEKPHTPKMFETLEDNQKSEWKAHVSTLVHAHDATFHDKSGCSPYFLMYGRNPRLAIDAFYVCPQIFCVQ